MIINDKKMPNEVLIAGGAGFIGSHLCKKLLQEGNKVFCLDDFSTGQRKNIEKFLSEKNFTLIEQNLCDDIEHEFKNLSMIFNFACAASPVCCDAWMWPRGRGRPAPPRCPGQRTAPDRGWSGARVGAHQARRGGGRA